MIAGRQVFQDERRGHVEVADGIEIGDVDGRHAEGAEQQESRAMSRARSGADAAGAQSSQSRRTRQAVVMRSCTSWNGLIPPCKEELRRRGAGGPAHGRKHDEEVAQSVFAVGHVRAFLARFDF